MLLRTRSILAQASILVLITLARSQENDSEYNVEDEAEDHSSYSGEGHQHPDYSKYYSADTSSPENAAQIQGRSDTGFVAPIEFANFFGTPHFDFGASNTNQEVLKPLVADVKEEANTNGFVSDKDFKSGFSEYGADGFGAQDYFEQAQKQEQKAEEGGEEESAEPKPGPNYISHRIPSKKGRYEAEVENLNDHPAKFESSRIRNSKAQEEDEGVDEKEDVKSNYEFNPSPPLNLAQFQPTNPSQIIQDVVGKAGQLPYNPEYYQKFTNTQQQISPYQKYSFQPAASSYGLKDAGVLNAFQSTVAPFNPSYEKAASTAATNYEFQPSEIIYQSLKGRECVKINKEVSDKGGKFKKQPMNCYVCKDPKSGSKYEQCSYTNEPNPKAYYTSTSQSYGHPEGHRNKRDEQQTYKDPYEEIKAKSHDYFSKPSEFNYDYYKSPDFSALSEEYHYSPESNEKNDEDKSYSELQSEELIKKGENCHKSHKNGVSCTVCKDPKTGANFEQCSYESAPNEKKYAYVKEVKLDGDGNPIEEKVTGSPQSAADEEKQDNSPLRRSDEVQDEDKAEESRTNEEAKEEAPKNSKLVDDRSYDVPHHFAESTYKQQKAGVRGLDPSLYGSSDSSEKSEESKTAPQKFTNLDEYHLKLFPQFANQESKQEETRAEPDLTYFEDLSGKKDVAKVLAEFAKKDRSNCKQIQKKGMTCYLCVDKKGVQQEECMYVSESRPQSSHVAYHEMQHLNAPKKAAAPEVQSEIIPEEAASSESQKRKKVVKKAVTPAPADSEANASTNVETRIKFVPSETSSKRVYRKAPKNKRDAESEGERDKYQLDDSQDPKPQFDVRDEGGLYTAETQPVYSRALGLSLPRYMLEKTYLEQEFDRTVAEE